MMALRWLSGLAVSIGSLYPVAAVSTKPYPAAFRKSTSVAKPATRAPRQQWKRVLEPLPKNVNPPVLGPVTADYAVVSTSANDTTTHLSAVRLDTGARLWKRPFQHLGHRVEDRGVLFVQRWRGADTSVGSEVAALDLATGRERWSAPCDTRWGFQWLRAAEGRVLWLAPGDTAVCAEGATGRVLWRLPNAGSPVGLGKGIALLQTGPPNPGADYGVYLHAVEAATGRRLRHFLFRGTEASGYDLTGARQLSQPELILGEESNVGVGYEDHTLRAVRPDGRWLWDAPESLSSPVRVGDLLVANWWRSGNQYDIIGVAAIELKTGKLVWKQTRPKGMRSQVVGAWNDSVLLFEMGESGKKPGRILVREALTRKLRWSLPTRANQVEVSGPWLVTLQYSPKGSALVGYRLE